MRGAQRNGSLRAPPGFVAFRLTVLTIELAEDDVEGAEDRGDVGEHVAAVNADFGMSPAMQASPSACPWSRRLAGSSAQSSARTGTTPPRPEARARG